MRWDMREAQSGITREANEITDKRIGEGSREASYEIRVRGVDAATK